MCVNAGANATLVEGKSRAGGYFRRDLDFLTMKMLLIMLLIKFRALLIQKFVRSSFNVSLTPLYKTLQ